MSFQFSHEFHRNWLAAPQAERQRIMNDLQAIVDLLDPETQLKHWQKQHGIYEKTALAAEQVSLFDAEPASETTDDATDTPETKVTDETDTKPTSEFLQQVTQGLNTNVELPDQAFEQANTTSHQTSSDSTITLSAEQRLEIEQAFDQRLNEHLTHVVQAINDDMSAWLNEQLSAYQQPTP